MLNNVSIILGTSNVGKCYIAAYVAKILVLSGKSVLIVDTTKNQNIVSMFNLSSFELSQIGGTKPLIRDNIEIIVKKIQIDIDLDSDFELDFVPQQSTEEILRNFNYENYDVVIVLADEGINQRVYKDAKNRFIVQNYDKGCLKKNVDLLNFLNKSCGVFDTNMIYYQIPTKTKFNINYIETVLRNISFRNKYEIFFDVNDFNEDINNCVDGQLNLKKYTSKRNEALFEIANEMCHIKDKYKNYSKLKGV